MALWRLRYREIPAARETDFASRRHRATAGATAAGRYRRPPTCRAGHASNAGARLPPAPSSSAYRGGASPIRRGRTRGRARRPARCAAPLCLAALARRFLVEARLPRARAELGLDFGERDAAGMEHDQEMVEHVGGLADDALTVFADRGNRRLDRLLAEFLGAMRHAAVEQLARVGHVGAFLRARLDALFEVVEGECLGHLDVP